MDLLYPLRVMIGRQLSPWKIARANHGWHREYMHATHALYRDGDNIVSGRAVDGFQWRLHHEVRTYTDDGKLKSIEYSGKERGTKERVNYDPPGRFVGRKVPIKKAA